MTASKTAERRNQSSSGRRADKEKSASLSRQDASRRIDDYIAEFDDWRGERLAELREIIREVNPDVVEDWKWMGTPVWSHRGMYAHGNIFKAKVKLTFHHGARLPDPDQLFNASLTAKMSRAIDIFEEDKLDVRALRTLLRAANEYNATHAVPQSKGSRDI
ncbi:MAG: DUF1801 domain-containing protein [Chloroflexi bacterium]|nr:DUF1801 domain-containing protein [Gemmatimonadota bacterium]MYD08493.1 DUF1801 domain-containing protein [Chloroflexota bacterium]